MAKVWSLVSFNDGLQIVPKSWVNFDLKQSYWPNYEQNFEGQDKFLRDVKACLNPDPKWKMYKVEILESYFDSLEKARAKLRIAQDGSDLNTDLDIKKKSRGQRKRKVVSDDEDSGESSENWEQSPDAKRMKGYPKFPKKKPTCSLTHQEPGKSNAKISSQKQSTCKEYVLNSTQDNSQDDTLENSVHLEEASNFCCKDVLEFLRKEVMNEIRQMRSDMMKEIRQMRLEMQAVREVILENNLPQRVESLPEDNNQGGPISDTLPLKNVEELLALEESLHTIDFQKQLIMELGQIGGNTLRSITKNILVKVFTNNLASKYNWEGLKGKNQLSSLILAGVIKKAVLTNKQVQHCTEADIIECIKNWLRHASARAKTKSRTDEMVANNEHTNE